MKLIHTPDNPCEAASWRDFLTQEIGRVFPEREAQHMAYQAIEDIAGISKLDILKGNCPQIEAPECDILIQVLVKLKSGMPYQYAIGHADFFGLRLSVNPSVLIPRPETEELVAWVLSDSTNEPSDVIDLCTGSGCIALALKNQRPFWKVSACDLSRDALNVAVENSKIHGSDVDFFECDVLDFPADRKKLVDILVSNPPYVRRSESSSMATHVTDYEPHIALFVADEDPLIFYRAIVDLAKEMLRPNGSCYFEINEALAAGVSQILSDRGFEKIESRKDMNGRDRMVKARRC